MSASAAKLTNSELQTALDILRSTFSYDPQTRWRSAYDALLPLRSQLRAANARMRRLIGWIGVAFLVAELACLALFLKTFVLDQNYSVAAWWMWLGAPLLLSFTQRALERAIRQRSRDAMLFETIDGVCSDFDNKVSAA